MKAFCIAAVAAFLLVGCKPAPPVAATIEGAQRPAEREAEYKSEGIEYLLTMLVYPREVSFSRMELTTNPARIDEVLNRAPKITVSDTEEFAVLLNKFLEWARIAKETKAVDFSKPIGEASKQPLKFVWRDSRASLDRFAITPADAEKILELLHQAPIARLELADNAEKAKAQSALFQ